MKHSLFLTFAVFLFLVAAQAHAAVPQYASQSITIAPNDSDDSVTITRPTGTSQGNFLLAAISTDGDETIGAPTGWIAVNQGQAPGDAETLAIFYKIATALEPASYTFTWSNQQAVGAILRYTGVDSTTPIAAFGIATDTSDSPTAPDVNSSRIDTMVVRVFGADDDDLAGSPYPTGTNGRIYEQSGNGNGTTTLGVADQTKASAGATGTAAFSLSSSEQWRAATIVLSSPAVPGVNPLPANDSNNAPKVCSTSGADGSSTTSSVVNTYYPATASVAANATSITLGTRIGSTTAISAGDLVMIIQMQDATINSTNTVNYGDNLGFGSAAGSTTINQTGLYEFAIAASFDGTDLVLTSGLTHAYNQGSNKTFQVIRVPRYADLTLSTNITAAAWDGSAGGVVVLDALGTLNFNNFNITASGSGFRQGVYVGGTSGDESNVDSAFVAVGAGNDADLWAEKGEGIAGTPGKTYFNNVNLGYPNGSLARGAPGNAGGGGNDHNGGGGGGSNIGYGGRGGDAWSVGFDAGGRGGGTFNGYVGRLLLGGGGGAANANNNSAAGAGGPGGGLVFINATTITGTGTIDVSGSPGVNSNVGFLDGNDGAGGGGGGGTVVIRTASPTVNNLTLNVSGGAGGNVYTPNPHGPGGGGGGGGVYIDATGATIDVTGGAAGTFFNPADSGNHGALPGGDGHEKTIGQMDIPVPVACDYPDETAYGSSTTIHQVDGAGGSATGLKIGSVVDFEPSGLGTVADATGDDTTVSTNPGTGNDEDGVVFQLVPGDSSKLRASISYVNPTGGNVNLCGWLDINNNGSYEAAEGVCNAVGASGSVNMEWSGLSTSSSYTVYSRFRITSNALTTADASGTTVTDGEAQAYKIDVNPTAVTIGKVELTATRVDDFLTALNIEQLDNAALYALLETWDAERAALLVNADRETLLRALRKYLDPDVDGQLAVLAWDTLEERGTIGFYVERRESEDGNWQSINKDMLPGLITAPMGGEYQLADPSAQSGTSYQYQLIEQEARGSKRIYGPYELRME